MHNATITPTVIYWRRNATYDVFLQVNEKGIFVASELKSRSLAKIKAEVGAEGMQELLLSINSQMKVEIDELVIHDMPAPD